MKSELYQIADELRAVASEGLSFAQNEYDLERYERALSLSARMIATMENRSTDEILTRFHDNLFHLSPLAGAEAVVLRGGQVLLIRRKDDGLWALPGGLTEVGETLAETAERELYEEAGIRARAVKLLGIFDSRLWQSQTKSQLYHAIFLVESSGDTPIPGPEATDAAFFGESNLPPLSAGHNLRIPFIFKFLPDLTAPTFFDK